MGLYVFSILIPPPTSFFFFFFFRFFHSTKRCWELGDRKERNAGEVVGGVSMQESHLFLLRTYFKAAGAFTAWLTDWRPECQKGEYTRNHASKLPTTTSPTFSGCRNFLSTSGSSGLACALTPVCGEGINQAPCSLHALGELPPCSVTAMGLKCGDSAPQGPQGNGALLELSRWGRGGCSPPH